METTTTTTTTREGRKDVSVYTDERGVPWIISAVVMVPPPLPIMRPEWFYVPFSDPEDARKYAASLRKSEADKHEAEGDPRLPLHIHVYLQAARLWASADEKIAFDSSVERGERDPDEEVIEHAPAIKRAFAADKKDAKSYLSDEEKEALRNPMGALLKAVHGEKEKEEAPLLN